MKTRFDGYLASAYSHPDPEVRHRRFVEACHAAGWAIKNGLWLYSPIAHTHSIAEVCDLPLGFDFWEAYDTVGVGSCKDLYILRNGGWDNSIGVWREINIAEDLGRGMFYMEKVSDTHYDVWNVNYATIVGANHVSTDAGKNHANLSVARDCMRAASGARHESDR